MNFKKLLLLLVLLIPFAFTLNVYAEEITTENSYLLFDMIEDSYFTNNGIDKNNCYFFTMERGATGIYVIISPSSFTRTSNYINFNDSVTSVMFFYKFSDSSFDFYSNSFKRTNFNTIFYSNSDILDTDGTVYFEKNYPIEGEVTPTPSPSPTPTPIFFSNKIYIPELTNYKCVYVRGDGVIRAYTEIPQNNATVTYRDFYINSNYIFTDGEQTFSQYTTVPTCLDSSVLTSKVYYRNDFDKILVIFICLCLIIFYIPIKILFRLFRRFN